MKYCFECGSYQQGLTHDLSKYSPTEFIPAASTIRATTAPTRQSGPPGLFSAWLHHKGRNKHHLEYWIDYTTNKSGLGGMKMPCAMSARWSATAWRPARSIWATSTPTHPVAVL